MAIIDSRLKDCDTDQDVTENFNRVLTLIDKLSEAVEDLTPSEDETPTEEETTEQEDIMAKTVGLIEKEVKKEQKKELPKEEKKK